jgi:PAS domain S-box-containing protein
MPPPLSREPTRSKLAERFTGLMADSIGDLLLVVDPVSLLVVAANSRAEFLLGLGPDELIGMPVRDLETELVDQAYWEEAAGGQFTPVLRVDTVYTRRDGYRIHVEKSTYQRELDGRPYIVIHSREVTDRHEIEEELERSASQLRATLESTADGILVLDPDGGIVNLNHQFSRLWRIPNDVIVAREDSAIRAIMSQWLKEPARNPILGDSLRAEPEAPSGAELELFDGRVLEYKSFPQYLRGRVIGRVFSFRDISDKIRRERELIEARDQAARASEAKSAFLAAMSHEIRTPMNGILGMTELALDTALAPLQREYIEAAHHSAESLLAILNDILDFSKIEAGRMELESTRFDLRELLRDAVRILLPRAAGQGLDLVLDIHPDLPDRVEGDPVRLRQILLNLLSNAVKFTQHGRVVLNAGFEPAASGEEIGLTFCVRDTGIGIAPHHMDTIFDSFTQADYSITRRFGGTGLGLAISRRLVEAMNGRIWVESELGRGSAFHFTARLRVSKEGPGKIAEADAEIDTGAGIPSSMAGLRILVAEDNPVNQKIAAIMLGRAGHLCISAKDGRETLEVWENGGIDLILMDVNMPEMDGVEATRFIRRREQDFGAHVPIVALTANAMVQDRQTYLDAGMDGYLSKPFRFDELLAVMQSVLRR